MSGLGRDETLELMQEECMELRRERDKLQAENDRLERRLDRLRRTLKVVNPAWTDFDIEAVEATADDA